MSSESSSVSGGLGRLDEVRRQVRRDRRSGSVPLEVMSVVMILVAAYEWVDWLRPVPGGADGGPMWMWAVVAPISFALIAWRYRRLESHVGVRTARRTFVWLAVGAVVSLVVLPVLMLPLGIPYAAVGFALLVVALRQRSPHLAVGAVVLGLGGLLESLSVLSNRIYEVAGAYVTWANAASWTLLAVLMVAVTVAAQRYEDRP